MADIIHLPDPDGQTLPWCIQSNPDHSKELTMIDDHVLLGQIGMVF